MLITLPGTSASPDPRASKSMVLALTIDRVPVGGEGELLSRSVLPLLNVIPGPAIRLALPDKGLYPGFILLSLIP